VDAAIVVAVIGAGATITAALVGLLKGHARKKSPHLPPLGLKYFHYISRAKIDMICSQLGLADQLDPQADLPRRTLEVVGALEKRGLVRNLDPDSDLERGIFFFRTNSTWRHGLFYFKAYDVTMVSYILWATHQSSLILLVGSPHNILGEKIAQDGVFVPGTSWAIDAIHQLLDSMRVDEPHYAEGHGRNHGSSDTPFQDIRIQRDTREDDYGFAMHLALSGALIQGGDSLTSPIVPKYESKFPKVPLQVASAALPLAVLCASHFAALPEAHLEILFRIFSNYLTTKKNLHQDLISAAREPHLRSRIRGLDLRKYNAVRVGSPVYSALA
jgi:hypothetical protein